MPTQFKLPELGENVESGEVVSVLVSEGDTVEQEQAVVELETEKATIEVPTSLSGTVKKVHVKKGDTVKVGQAILTIDEDKKKPGEKKEEPKKKLAPEPEKEEPQKPAAVAEKAEERVEKKAAPAPRERKAEAREEPAPSAAEAAPAAPSVRRLARELGVDINKVSGSGPGGRISDEDVKEYAQRMVTGAVEMVGRGGAPAAHAATSLPDFSRWGEIERRPMSNVRRKTAEHMSLAWGAIPHVTQYDQADVTEVEKLRKRFAKKAEAAGGKLTLTAIALKVVASALDVFPQFAASVDMAADQVVYKKYRHIGVAVDTDRGLLVPVIRDVDKKNIIALAVELNELAERARNKKVTLEEMSGGVFSITNLGGIGGTAFSPIVNYPEVAILGMARSRTEPVWVEGKFEPRIILPLSLSYDHRLIDGADAARFLRWVCAALEEPFLLALEG